MLARPGDKEPLILVSGAHPIRDLEAPRIDYIELADALGNAPLLYSPADRSGLMAAIEKRLAVDIRQARSAFVRRHQVSAFVSLSERVGIPLALMLGRRNRIPHVLVAHNVTSDNKKLLQRFTRYLDRFSQIVVLCHSQERYVIEEAQIPKLRVHFVYDKVDDVFWSQDLRIAADPASRTGPVVAVGRERRDYGTLAEAAKLLPQRRFVIVASSPWSRARSGVATSVPSNVEVRSNLSWTALRSLYASASMVVVPLISGTMYGAGLNGVLEGMAMRKALVVTYTPGIADYIDEGVNARVIKAGDSVAMASAVEALYSEPLTSGQLAAGARRVIDEGRNMQSYVTALSAIIRSAASNIE